MYHILTSYKQLQSNVKCIGIGLVDLFVYHIMTSYKQLQSNVKCMLICLFDWFISVSHTDII